MKKFLALFFALAAFAVAAFSVIDVAPTPRGQFAYNGPGGKLVAVEVFAPTNGTVNLKTAFKRSCNVTFGKLAYQLGLERLRQTAELWLSQNETELQPRFDVIEVYAPQGEKGPLRVVHHENAFY